MPNENFWDYLAILKDGKPPIADNEHDRLTTVMSPWAAMSKITQPRTGMFSPFTNWLNSWISPETTLPLAEPDQQFTKLAEPTGSTTPTNAWPNGRGLIGADVPLGSQTADAETEAFVRGAVTGYKPVPTVPMGPFPVYIPPTTPKSLVVPQSVLLKEKLANMARALSGGNIPAPKQFAPANRPASVVPTVAPSNVQDAPAIPTTATPTVPAGPSPEQIMSTKQSALDLADINRRLDEPMPKPDKQKYDSNLLKIGAALQALAPLFFGMSKSATMHTPTFLNDRNDPLETLQRLQAGETATENATKLEGWKQRQNMLSRLLTSKEADIRHKDTLASLEKRTQDTIKAEDSRATANRNITILNSQRLDAQAKLETLRKEYSSAIQASGGETTPEVLDIIQRMKEYEAESTRLNALMMGLGTNLPASVVPATKLAEPTQAQPKTIQVPGYGNVKVKN